MKPRQDNCSLHTSSPGTFQSPIHVASPVHSGWLVGLGSLSKVKHIMNLILLHKEKHLSFHIGCGVSQQCCGPPGRKSQRTKVNFKDFKYQNTTYFSTSI